MAPRLSPFSGALCALVALQAGMAVAQEEAPPDPPAASPRAAEPVLPVVAPVSRYEPIWKNSPFELEAAPQAAAAARQSFAKDYALAGMLKQGDETVLYIINRKTKEITRVTREADTKSGFKLRSIQGASTNVREVEATVEKDGEVAHLTYDADVMASVAANKTQANPPNPNNANPRDATVRAVETVMNNPGGANANDPARTAALQGEGASQSADAVQPSDGAATGQPPTSASRRRIVLPKSISN